jgi:hypothetical protein
MKIAFLFFSDCYDDKGSGEIGGGRNWLINVPEDKLLY